MTEVHEGSPMGQGSGPSQARACLARFLDAAYELNEAWNPILDVRTYPRYVPAFYEFLSDLTNWREEVENGPDSEPRKPLNLTDRKEVSAWLTDVRKNIKDVVAAGKDAMRPLAQRELGRRTARHLLLDAADALDQLLEAADRGVG